MSYWSELRVDVGSDPLRLRPGRTWVRNRYHVHQRLWMAFADCPYTAPMTVEARTERTLASRKGEAGAVRPFLYRIVTFPSVHILVRSDSCPDWERAFETAPFLVRQPLCAPEQEKIAYDVGQELRFSLLANATRKIARDQRKNGSRIGLRTDDELESMAAAAPGSAEALLSRKGEVAEWIARKAAAGGFALTEWHAAREARCTSRKAWGQTWDRTEVDGRISAKRCADPRQKRYNLPAPEVEYHERFCHMRFDVLEFSGRLRVTDSGAFAKVLSTGIGTAKAFGFGMLCVRPV